MAYTLSEFLEKVQQGNPLLVRNTLFRSDVTMDIGGRRVILSYEYPTKVYNIGGASDVVTDLGTLDLGTRFSVAEILRSESLKYAISNGFIEVLDGTVSIPAEEGRNDPLTGNKATITTEHGRIHTSDYYTVTYTFTGVGAAASVYLHIKAPNTSTRIHLLADVIASKNGTGYIYRAPTLSGNGTALTPFNSDDNSSNTTEALTYYTPTVSNDGTLRKTFIIGTDSVNPVGREGERLRRENEIIMKQNTSYLLKFTALTADTRATLGLYFYEEG